MKGFRSKFDIVFEQAMSLILEENRKDKYKINGKLMVENASEMDFSKVNSLLEFLEALSDGNDESENIRYAVAKKQKYFSQNSRKIK